MSIATVTARMRAHGKSKVLLDTFADAIDQAAAAEREALQQQKPYGWIVEWFPTDDVGDTLMSVRDHAGTRLAQLRRSAAAAGRARPGHRRGAP